VYTGEGSPDLRSLFSPTFLWHSDVSSPTNLSIYAILTHHRSHTNSSLPPTPL
jgi:hypothetical protein